MPRPAAVNRSQPCHPRLCYLARRPRAAAGMHCPPPLVLRRPWPPSSSILGLLMGNNARCLCSWLPRRYDEFGRPRKRESAADREARERAALDRLQVISRGVLAQGRGQSGGPASPCQPCAACLPGCPSKIAFK